MPNFEPSNSKAWVLQQ